jgi:membrane fusion protein, multidrug efflux system
MNRRTWKPVVLAALWTLPILAGCSGQEAKAPQPVPEVAVVTVQRRKVVLSTELPGRTSSHLVAEIRPQANGLIQKRLFTEGADVKAGQVLYQIEPAPFQAVLDSAAASLDAAKKAADQARAALGASTAGVARQEATVALAKTERQRAEDLFKERAGSASDRDKAVTACEVAEATLRVSEAQVANDRAAVAAAEAAIKQAEAALQTARINLGYTQITAPISGRIGRSTITEGAIVTAYQPLPLATIQNLDPLYVDVPQSTAELNRLRRSLASGRLESNGADRVRIIQEDGAAYPHEGKLKFRDITVDPSTGSVILRIEVPNPDSVLLPGMFVRAVVEEGTDERAILVPQQAVARDPKGNPLALVLGADGTVEQRRLTADRAIGDQWLVSSGLATGDRVIVEGTQKVRPGMPARIAQAKHAGPATASTRPN